MENSIEYDLTLNPYGDNFFWIKDTDIHYRTEWHDGNIWYYYQDKHIKECDNFSVKEFNKWIKLQTFL